MMTRLGKAASKAFGPRAPKIPQIGLGRNRGLKPRMAGTTGVPFQTNLGDDLEIPGKDKIKGAKPSMAGMVCPFFGASNLETSGDSIISLIMTKVGEASILILGGTLQRHSRKYSSQSFLDPTIIALWLVPAWAQASCYTITPPHDLSFDPNNATVG